MKFKFSVNVVVQVLAVILHALNQYGALVPANYQFYVTFALAFLQALSALLAHFVNPDGTSAKAAWVPKS
jgi:hypothetical protein